jgi:hypothetical protein
MCVLGQCHPFGYEAGLHALNLSDAEAREHGFFVDEYADYEDLTVMWRKLARERVDITT